MQRKRMRKRKKVEGEGGKGRGRDIEGTRVFTGGQEGRRRAGLLTRLYGGWCRAGARVVTTTDHDRPAK
jgi:hypothetical protein